jgi:hypothetical protein
MADSSTIPSALAPGVALTSAVIYWANLQSRLDAISARVRSLNAEQRTEIIGSLRAVSIDRQVELLSQRSRVLHRGVLLSVVALVGFLGSSAVIFVPLAPGEVINVLATTLFFAGLAAFGVSLLVTLYEMLWARRSLEEDIRSSKPTRQK